MRLDERVTDETNSAGSSNSNRVTCTPEGSPASFPSRGEAGLHHFRTPAINGLELQRLEFPPNENRIDLRAVSQRGASVLVAHRSGDLGGG
jgi:hypothetical protein